MGTGSARAIHGDLEEARMNRSSIAILVVIIAALAVSVLYVGDPFLSSSPTTTSNQENQILFVGPGFNQTVAARNSTVVENFEVNITQPSMMKFTLGDEKYYPTTGALGNGSAFSTVNTFQNGSISAGGATYLFGTMRDCTATAATTQTLGNTVRESATCNATTVKPVTGTEIRANSPGLLQLTYSLQVPANAAAGVYLVFLTIQGQSMENFADMSNNLVYISTIAVS